MALTSRERVLLALQHKEPDLIPVDFGSTRSTGINAFAYYKLKRYLRFEGRVKIFDLKQLLADIDSQMLNFFRSDCIQLSRLSPSMGLKTAKWKSITMMDGNTYEVPFDFNPIELEDGSNALLDNNGVITMKRPKDGLYFDDVYYPLHNASTQDEIDNYKYPIITDEEITFLTVKAQELYNNSNYAIVGSTGVSIFEKGIKDFGYEEFLIKIYTDRKLILRYLENLVDAYLEFLEKYLNAVGSYIQVIQFNDDLGMQTSTILSPDIYRSIFKPYHKIIYEFVKKKAPHLKILLHSCGSIYDVIPDLIDVGVDALNPVQTNAAKMDPAALKREYGKHITFWGGGCSTQSTLTFGNALDIADEVKRNIDLLSPSGGFVFNQIHNIQANVTPENILAMYQTFFENRDYCGGVGK